LFGIFKTKSICIRTGSEFLGKNVLIYLLKRMERRPASIYKRTFLSFNLNKVEELFENDAEIIFPTSK